MVALLARCERMKEAATVAAAVGRACEASGFKPGGAYTSNLVQSAVASARQSLPAAEFDAAWSTGLAMPCAGTWPSLLRSCGQRRVRQP
jgi:hypothetical protein